MRKRGLAMTIAPNRRADVPTPISENHAAFGRAVALSCRECGERTDLGPKYVCESCFGPLEIAYDFGTVTRAQIERGPKSVWRYAPLLPVPADVAARPNLNT